MAIWQGQTSFSSGVLSPKMAGRYDLSAYYKGMRTGQNVSLITQGGVARRPGFQYIDTIGSAARVFPFSFNVEQDYLLVFTAGNISVYQDDLEVASITSPYSSSDLSALYSVQTADTMVICHEDYAPRLFTRTGATTFTLTLAPLINLPQFDFSDSSSPTPTSEQQRINIVGMEQGSTIKLGLEGILTEDFSYEGPNSDMAEAIREQLQSLPNTGSSGISVVFSSGSEFNANFVVTFAGSSANDWRLVTGFMVQGAASGDERVNSTRLQTGTSRAEDVWSATRGWPKTCTFHESRLYFGGSKSRPQTIWGSNVAQFFNFNAGRALDDESIDITLDTEQVNAITGLVSDRNLQIYTAGGEFFVPDRPITPSSISFPRQSQYGSLPVKPITLDGVTLYAQRSGLAIRQFILTDLGSQTDSYQSQSVSLLAEHLINQPVEMASSRGADTDVNYAYILNSDGKLSVLNLLGTESLNGWTQWFTNGAIKSIATLNNVLYLIIERDNGVFLEKESPETFNDSSVIATPASAIVTGLDHLEGETVVINADGAVQPPETVVGGQITLGRSADRVDVGLPFNPVVETMPLNSNINGFGVTVAKQKRIVRANANVLESLGIIINGERIPDREYNQDQFDQAPEPATGRKEIYLLGWSVEATATVTQDAPLPFHLLDLSLEVEI